MKTPLAAALLAVLASLPSFADGAPDPGDVEASFPAARLKDDLSGVLGDPAKEVRFAFYASAGSTVSLTLASDAAEGTVITGLALTLCDEAGTDLAVAGSAFDRSVPGSGVISWKKVPLATAGAYTLILRGTGAGVWHMKLAGALAKSKEKVPSAVDLGVNAEASVDVHGVRGGALSFGLAAAGGSKFKGELVRIERPDATPLDGVPIASKGRVTLDADGVHKLVFRNVGAGVGAWTAKTSVTPPKLLKRRGFVRPQGTALVPKVLTVFPASGFNKDQAAAVTLTGRDFQPGADVRLVRNGYDDILGTDIHVDSETQVRFTLNLDTSPVTGSTSVGTWNVGVWNAPVYGTADDRTTLVKDSPTLDRGRTFNSLSSGSITLPPGVVKETEVWQLAFNDDFQGDLNRLGLGSGDGQTERLARETVEAYVVCFLRDLFQVNETTGKVAKGTSPPVSFILGTVPTPAGRPGEDYNRIEIGGAWQTGDERDAAEPLLWGFAATDAGNLRRDDLSNEISDGAGGTTHVGRGARTRVLDPNAAEAHQDWIAATSTIRQNPLTAADRRYFVSNFAPATVAEANRYRDIVEIVTRASREIAAIVGHHVGRAMGLATGGFGPMANPDKAGNLWPTTSALGFAGADVATLRDGAVPHLLPGSSKTLTISYFALISTQPSVLPNLTTAVPYAVNWNYVGGRPNAPSTDYTVRFTGGVPPLDLTLGFTGLSGTARLYIDAAQGSFYCNIHYFRVTVTDTVRGGAANFAYRLNVLPNIPLLRPGVEQQNATNCKNTILATP